VEDKPELGLRRMVLVEPVAPLVERLYPQRLHGSVCASVLHQAAAGRCRGPCRPPQAKITGGGRSGQGLVGPKRGLGSDGARRGSGIAGFIPRKQMLEVSLG